MGYAERANPNSLYNRKRHKDKPIVTADEMIHEEIKKNAPKTFWQKVKDFIWKILPRT